MTEAWLMLTRGAKSAERCNKCQGTTLGSPEQCRRDNYRPGTYLQSVQFQTGADQRPRLLRAFQPSFARQIHTLVKYGWQIHTLVKYGPYPGALLVKYGGVVVYTRRFPSL